MSKDTTVLLEEDIPDHQKFSNYRDQATDLEREAKRLLDRAQRLMGAYLIWVEEMHEKYDLAMDGSEGINDNGTIVRNAV